MPKLSNTDLRYKIAYPASLLRICFGIIDQYGLQKAMAGKDVSDFKIEEPIFEDPFGAAPYFSGQSKIRLSTTESIAMAYLALYYQEKSEGRDTEYFIGVDIEDAYADQTEREEYCQTECLLSIPRGLNLLSRPSNR